MTTGGVLKGDANRIVVQKDIREIALSAVHQSNGCCLTRIIVNIVFKVGSDAPEVTSVNCCVRATHEMQLAKVVSVDCFILQIGKESNWLSIYCILKKLQGVEIPIIIVVYCWIQPTTVEGVSNYTAINRRPIR